MNEAITKDFDAITSHLTPEETAIATEEARKLTHVLEKMLSGLNDRGIEELRTIVISEAAFALQLRAIVEYSPRFTEKS